MLNKKGRPEGRPELRSNRLTTGITPVVRCHAFPAVETKTQVFANEYLFFACWTDEHTNHLLPEAACLGRLKDLAAGNR